jgi:hypothetical protein
MPHIENMKLYQNHWSLIRGQFFITSNPHFQASTHLILKIINYFLREQVADLDPHSVSYWYLPYIFDADPEGLDRNRTEILIRTYTVFGQGMISGISPTPLSIPGFQSFHVCNEVGEPHLELFVLGLQLCQLCPQLKKRSG